MASVVLTVVTATYLVGPIGFQTAHEDVHAIQAFKGYDECVTAQDAYNKTHDTAIHAITGIEAAGSVLAYKKSVFARCELFVD